MAASRTDARPGPGVCHNAPMGSDRRSASRASVVTLMALLAAGGPSAAQEAVPDPLPLEARPFFFALSVRNVDESRAWYERVFGLRTVRSMDVEERGLRIRLLAREGTFLELGEISGAGAAADLEPGLEKRQLLYGVFKVGFEVADLDRALARLEALEVELRGGPITESDGSMRSAQVEDPDGNIIQLFEMLD